MNLTDVLSEMGLANECRGDMEFECLGLAASAPGAPALSFVESARYADGLGDDIACVICPAELATHIRDRGVCLSTEPRSLFFAIHNHLADDPSYRRPAFETRIGDGCDISPLAFVAPEGVVIGDGCIIEEFASIKEGTVLGDGCVVRAGAVVGGEGFEVKRIDGRTVTVRHLGGVRVEDNVEVQQNACVDRAVYPWDDTALGEGARIDNLVHIAHGVKLGRRVEVACLTCVAGRTVVGDDVWIGPGCTLRNGIEVGDGARVNMGSVVSRSVPAGESVTGNFAIEHSRFLRNVKISAAADLRSALEESSGGAL